MPIRFSTDPMLLDCTHALSVVSLIILYAINSVFYVPLRQDIDVSFNSQL
jgi:hypothetical protein